MHLKFRFNWAFCLLCSNPTLWGLQIEMKWSHQKGSSVLRPISRFLLLSFSHRELRDLVLHMATEAPHFLLASCCVQLWTHVAEGPWKAVHQSSGPNSLVCKIRKLGSMTFHIDFPFANFWEAIKLPWYNDFNMVWIFFLWSQNLFLFLSCPYPFCSLSLHSLYYYILTNLTYLQSTAKWTLKWRKP